MTSHPATPARYPQRAVDHKKESGVVLKIVALFLGIAVGILSIVAVVLVKTADDARYEAKAAAATTDPATDSSAASTAVSLPLQSFAGKTVDNACAHIRTEGGHDEEDPDRD